MAQGTSTGKPPSRCPGAGACAYTHEYRICHLLRAAVCIPPRCPRICQDAKRFDEVLLSALARAAGIAGGGGGGRGPQPPNEGEDDGRVTGIGVSAGKEGGMGRSGQIADRGWWETGGLDVV
jgi:hypothetical protein